MCRFLAYAGTPVTMDVLLYKPKNSLVKQSKKALERKDPLNADGFGLGWYVPEIDPQPATFVSTRPAWNDFNLPSIAPKIQSPCIFAHVRAASHGSISEVNCHPFRYEDLLLMHNGRLIGFRTIQRALRARLTDETYGWIRGATDSEHFFALFLDRLNAADRDDPVRVANVLETSLAEILSLFQDAGVRKPFFLNTAITNGRWIIATRYATHTDEPPPTLYWAAGSRFDCGEGDCYMQTTDTQNQAVLVTSEKLTGIVEDWHPVPLNHLLIMTPALVVETRPITISD